MQRQIEALTMLLVLLGASGRAAEPQDLRVALEIVPATTLPGIPVRFRFTFENPGTLPAALPPQGLVVATDDGGHSFLVWPRPIWLDDFWKGPIPAGGSASVELRPRGSFNEGFFVEELRLHRPGEFRFHVVAGKFPGDEEGFFSIPDTGIRSSDVTLHVIEPVGVDLDAWREIARNRQGEWIRVWDSANPALAARIVRQYPDSQYAGWIAASGISQTAHESAELLRWWLSRVNRDEYTEARELRLALFDDTAARQWTQISDAEVLCHVRSARALLEKLKNSKDPYVASHARQQLLEVAQTEETVRERGPRVP